MSAIKKDPQGLMVADSATLDALATLYANHDIPDCEPGNDGPDEEGFIAIAGEAIKQDVAGMFPAATFTTHKHFTYNKIVNHSGPDINITPTQPHQGGGLFSCTTPESRKNLLVFGARTIFITTQA